MNMKSSIIGLVLSGCVALAGCGGGDSAGDFEGVYTGNEVTMSMATATGTGGGMLSNTDNKTVTTNLHVEPARVMSADMIVYFDGSPCVLQFTKSGEMATLVSGQSCMIQNNDMSTNTVTGQPAMTTTTMQNVMLTFQSGSMTLSNTSLSFSAMASVSISASDTSMPTQNYTAMGTISITFNGTRQ